MDRSADLAGSDLLVGDKGGASRGPSLFVDDDEWLRTRLCEALAYATGVLTHLDRLAPLWPAEVGRGPGDDALLRRRDKVAAEGLLLAFLAARASEGDRRLADAVEALVDRAEAHLATPRSEAVLRRFPQTVTTLGLSFVLLSALGRRRPVVEELLRQQLRRGWATVSERSPYRLMDMRWTFSQIDPALLGSPTALLPFSTLAAAPHPITSTSEDDYALTHAVFYATDFGQQPPPAELSGRAADLLDPFLVWHAVQFDLDLLGEMLITALCLRMPRTPSLVFACETFASAWENGGLVGPEYSAERAAALEGEEREAYEEGEHYHTRFVGGILCAVALASGGRAAAPAPAAVNASAAAAPREDLLERTIARLLQALAQPLAPAPPWLRVAGSSAAARSDLERVLGDALLIATARRYLLVQLAEALATATTHASLRTPTFARALDFLLDQRLADGRVGIQHLLAARERGQSAPDEEIATASASLADRVAELAREHRAERVSPEYTATRPKSRSGSPG